MTLQERSRPRTAASPPSRARPRFLVAVRRCAAAGVLALFAAACKSPAPVDLASDRPVELWACGPAEDGGWECAENTAAAGVRERAPRRRASSDLAYQPARPTRLLDLPGDYYAVQLAIRDSRAGIGAFEQAHGLTGLPRVRVARRGRLAYVLLAGVYRDRETAAQARGDFPKRLGSMRPWVRRLRSLQEAMRRADALSGSATAHEARIGGK